MKPQAHQATEQTHSSHSGHICCDSAHEPIAREQQYHQATEQTHLSILDTFVSQKAGIVDHCTRLVPEIHVVLQTEESSGPTKVESPASAPQDSDGFKAATIKSPTGGFETLPGVKAKGEEFKYGVEDQNVFKGGRAQVR
jgi:hypothetical protein